MAAGRAGPVDARVARLVPESVARYTATVPLREEGDVLVLAAAATCDEERLALVRAVTGRELRRVDVPAGEVERLRRTVYRHDPPPHRPERRRAPASSPVTLVTPPELGVATTTLRLSVLVGVAAAVVALYALQEFLWGEGRPPVQTWERFVAAAGYVWAVPIIPALFALAGFALYRKPEFRSRELTPLGVPVCFRVVARGENAFRLRATVSSIRAEMAALPLFPYSIEVVTDLPVDLGNGNDLSHFVVPQGYRTRRASRFKARALQYALEQSTLPDNGWIVHLDEESHITPSLVVGVRNAIEEEERAGTCRIGQGAILYHRDLRERPFLTLADSVRTGDDVGRFHLQHRFGITIFGLHGSWILVRNDVERAVGFDLGESGSITEDSFWALRQMEAGRRCRWVDGYVAEQAPRSVADFVKQRRRWFVGLESVSVAAPVALRFRAALAVSTTVWSLSWIGVLYLYVNLVVGFRVPEWVQAAGNVAFATYIATYVVGLKVNLENMPRLPWAQRAGLYVAQVALIPVFAVLEAAGVVYGLARRETGFHVIRK
ncbi:MAG TPA: glycosyltransferase family 2 protein [Gaiellaceae bacterium]|nr:glycosyltransferase family 2 protein [Gaiellaceae bacterium]